MSNMSVLLAVPHYDLSAVAATVVIDHGWIPSANVTHSHRFCRGPLMVFTTPLGVEVMLQAIIVDLPRYYLNNPVVPTCDNRSWSLSYSLYSGAVFSYHMLHLPVLSKFDYFIKLDTDIEFVTEWPFDVGEDMAKRGCTMMHSAIEGSNDCEDGALEAVLAFSEDNEVAPPKSANYSWCNENGEGKKASVYIFGNFMGYSTKFLLDPHIQALSEYMYEYWEDGYLAHRWGDQAPFVMYVCYLLDIPDLRNDAQVCDYSEYRNKVFYHHK